MITYNNKDILKSFIGNNRVIKKYLNNEVVYGTPDFAQYYNIQGYDNYEVVGSPTITDGIVSNFTYDNYFKTAESISTTGISSFEFYSRVKTPTTFSNGWCRICSAGTLGNQGTTAGIWSNSSVTQSFFHLFGIDIYQQLLTTNTWYRIQYLYSPSSYTATVYDDNGNVLKSYTYSNPKLNLQGVINFCQRYQGYVLGAIDLNNTYIKVNGKYWFNGNLNYKELLDCNNNIYLQSSGTQYIDTGIYGTDKTDFVISWKRDMADSFYQGIMGARLSTSSNRLTILSGVDDAELFVTVYPENQSQGYEKMYSSLQALAKRTIKKIGNSLQLDNGEVFSYNAPAAFTTPETLKLFATDSNGNVGGFLIGKIYPSVIYENNILVRNFVPVPQGLQIGTFTVPSNGMFDIVTQTFFENKGSGEFIWGVDL